MNLKSLDKALCDVLASAHMPLCLLCEEIAISESVPSLMFIFVKIEFKTYLRNQKFLPEQLEGKVAFPMFEAGFTGKKKKDWHFVFNEKYAMSALKRERKFLRFAALFQKALRH